MLELGIIASIAWFCWFIAKYVMKPKDSGTQDLAAPITGPQATTLVENYFNARRQIERHEAHIAALETDLIGTRQTIQSLSDAVEYHQKRESRAIAKQPSGPRDAADLLRRAYHAIRILHDFRHCKLKGCEYCRLGEEIVSSVSAQEIQSETTIRKKARE